MLLSEVTGVKPCTRTFTPSDDFIDPLCVVGVEFELEDVSWRSVNVNSELWVRTEDGSLRNGIEFVSRPVFGEDINLALRELSNAMDGHSYTLSWRCGLHIHLDVSAFTVEQLLAFCVGTALVEPALYKYVGIDRRHNIYCLPLSNTDNLLPYLNGIKYGQTPRDVQAAIQSMCKYSGFNILPVGYQGSVEFRYHKATMDMDVVKKWINILMTIREVAKTTPAVDLANMTYEQIKATLLYDQSMEYTRSDYLSGYIVAKDILNFNRLKTSWNDVKDMLADVSRVKLTPLEDV